MGAETVSLLAGQSFSVQVDPADLWSAGALPRWSNADGLSGPRWATGTDDSLQAAGTPIGRDFGLHTQAGLSAPYGTLVGQVGNGAYFVVGTSFSGLATQAGKLKLSCWDSNFGDNSQSIRARVVSGVPEPQTYAMLLAGMVAVGFVVGRRRRWRWR